MNSLCFATLKYWKSSVGYLQQDRQFLPRRCRIGDHQMAAINVVNHKLVTEKIVNRLSVDGTLSIAVLKEILADQDGQFIGEGFRRLDFFVQDDDRDRKP